MPMTPNAFITKWRAAELKERSAAQEHFIDLCRLLVEPTPAEAGPTGGWYCFERGARKDTDGDGWADVWKRHHFAWEYKGKHADLDAALPLNRAEIEITLKAAALDWSEIDPSILGTLFERGEPCTNGRDVCQIPQGRLRSC